MLYRLIYSRVYFTYDSGKGQCCGGAVWSSYNHECFHYNMGIRKVSYYKDVSYICIMSWYSQYVLKWSVTWPFFIKTGFAQYRLYCALSVDSPSPIQTSHEILSGSELNKKNYKLLLGRFTLSIVFGCLHCKHRPMPLYQSVKSLEVKFKSGLRFEI